MLHTLEDTTCSSLFHDSSIPSILILNRFDSFFQCHLFVAENANSTMQEVMFFEPIKVILLKLNKRLSCGWLCRCCVGKCCSHIKPTPCNAKNSRREICENQVVKETSILIQLDCFHVCINNHHCAFLPDSL